MSDKKLVEFYRRFFSTKKDMVNFLIKVTKSEKFPEMEDLFRKTLDVDFPNEIITFKEFILKMDKVLDIDLNSEIYLRSIMNIFSSDGTPSIDDLERMLVTLDFKYDNNKMELFYKMMFELPYIIDNQVYIKKIENSVEKEITKYLDTIQ